MLSIPLYIRLLGVAEWGIVAACVSLQIVSNFIDAGISQIFPRWIAKAAHSPNLLSRYMLLFRRISVCLGLLMFTVLQGSAGFLAEQWFKVPPESANALELAIRIMSFQFLFQFVNNVHNSFWNGLQRQVLANIRACGFGTLKHCAAIAMLAFVSPQAWLYALIFALVSFMEVCANALTVQHMLRKKKATPPGEEPRLLRPLAKEVSILSGGIFIGLLVSQLDRIILSRTVELQLYGVYVVVITLALAFLQLQIPISRAYLPLLVQDFQSKGRVSVFNLRKILFGTVLCSTLPALLACFFAPQILTLWLHDPFIVEAGSGPLRILLLAIALNTLYGCIYQVIVAMGEGQIIFYINLICLVAAGLTVLIFSPPGIMLGAAIWLTCSITQMALGGVWIAQRRSKNLI